MPSIKLSIEDDDPWAVSQDIFDLLCDFVQPSALVSATDVAGSLNALYPDNRVQGDGKKESAESFLLEMWNIVLKVAVQLESGSAEQAKLALLIKTLRNIEPEQTLHIWGSPIVLWKELPLLGPAMTERFNTIPNNAQFSDHEVWAKDRQQMQNFHAFAALLTKDGFDCSSHACWLLCSALEHPITSELSTGKNSEPKSRSPSGSALKAVMTAAAFWISQCCGVIYERSQKDRSTIDTEGLSWHGKDGFSLGRYRLWQRRFSEIAGDDKIEKSIRDLAARAELEMRELET